MYMYIVLSVEVKLMHCVKETEYVGWFKELVSFQLAHAAQNESRTSHTHVVGADHINSQILPTFQPIIAIVNAQLIGTNTTFVLT